MSNDKQTLVQQLASWVESRSYDDLSDEAIKVLKLRLLDSIGVGIGALEGQPVKDIRTMTEDLGGAPLVTLLGGSKSSPDYATFYNGAAIRYLDYNDSYLAKNETCHPSDNIAPVLAATEYAGGSGKDFLLGLGIAYHVQGRLYGDAPVRDHGFVHTVKGS